LLRQAFTEHVNRRRASQLEAKMVVLVLALGTLPFSSQPLGVHLFGCAHARPHWDARAHARLLSGEMHIAAVPDHMLARITHGDAALCPELSRVRADESDSDSDGADNEGGESRSGAASEEGVSDAEPDAHAQHVGSPCFVCALEIERRAVACACGVRCHPTCLAALFLPAADDAPLIPTGGRCPGCKAHALWPDLVRRGMAAQRPATRAPARSRPLPRLAEAETPREARADAAVDIDCTLDDSASEASADEGIDCVRDASAGDPGPSRPPPAHSAWQGGDEDADRSVSPLLAAADDDYGDWQPEAWADDELEWAPEMRESGATPPHHSSAERHHRSPDVIDMTLSDDDDGGGGCGEDESCANVEMRRASASSSPVAQGEDARTAPSDDDSDAGCYDMRPLVERLDGARAGSSLTDMHRHPLRSVDSHRTVIELDDSDSEPEQRR
jgi:hypothetical protein